MCRATRMDKQLWICVIALLLYLPYGQAYAHDESQIGDPEQQRQVTRAEFANMIASVLKLDPDEETVYSDSVKHWAGPYIGAVCKAGLMSADDDGLFHPDSTISFEQEAVVLVHTLHLKVTDSATPDSGIFSAWAAPYVKAALEHQSISNTDDYTKAIIYYDAVSAIEKIDAYLAEEKARERLRSLK